VDWNLKDGDEYNIFQVVDWFAALYKDMKYRNEKYYSDHQNEVSHEDFYPAQVFNGLKGRYNRASEAVEAGIVETKDRFLRAAPLAALIAVDELKVWEN